MRLESDGEVASSWVALSTVPYVIAAGVAQVIAGTALFTVSVTVLEADYVGRHASGVNAGGVRTLGRPLPEIPLALMSREIWHNIVETIGDDAGFVASGQLKIAESENSEQHSAHKASHETSAERLQAIVP